MKLAVIIAAVIFAAGAIPAVVIIAYRIIRFWAGLAQGMNEASEEHRRGFEVKLNTGEEPVIKEERDNDHG